MTMLTDTQLIVLSKAAAREDAAAIVPPKINKAAAAKIGSRLIDEPDVTYQPVSSKCSDLQRADRHQAGAAPRPKIQTGARRRDAVQAGAVLSVAMLHDPLTPVLAAAAILMGIGV